MAGYEYESSQVRALREISSSAAAKQGVRDLQQTLMDLNGSVRYMADYMIVMQKGIDEANKDIFQKIGDFINDMIIVFNGGSGLNFDFGDLARILTNISNILGFDQFLTGPINLANWAIEFFANVMQSPIVQRITTMINNFIADLLMALDWVSGGLFNLDELADYFRGQAGVTTGNSKKIDDLQRRLAEGSTFNDTFDRPNTNDGTLGNGWVQGGEGQRLQIIDNAARIYNVGISTGKRWARCPVVASGDDATVSAVVNPKGVARAVMTSLFIRANSDMTEFIYANMYARECYMGRGTRNPTTGAWSFTDFPGSGGKNTSKSVSEGALVELSAVGNKYILQVDGITRIEYVDPAGAGQYPIDGAHRTVGFQSETKIIGLFAQYSWGLAAFALRPYELKAIETANTNANIAVGTANAISGTAGDAMDAAIAAQQAVANLQNEQEGGGITVTTINEDFPGNTTELDSVKWSSPRTGDRAIRHHNGNASLQWKWLNNQYHAWAIHKNPLSITDQVVRVVMGTASYEDQGTGIILNASSPNPAVDSNFLFLQFYKNRIKIGKAHTTAANPGDIVWDVEFLNKTDGISIGNGSIVEFRSHTIGSITTLTARVNGNLVGSFSGNSLINANQKYVGFFMQRWENIFGQYWVSGNIKHFFASDYVLPSLASPGWSVYRAAEAASDNPINVAGYQQFVGEVFDTLGGVSGLDVIDFRRGVFLVKKSGWYSINMRLQSSVANGTTSLPRAVIFSSTANSPTFPVIRRVGVEGAASSNAYTFGVSCTLYLYEGERVWGGMYSSTTTRKLVGDALASVTYFEGALIGQ